ncbi:hypothetical protein PAMC26510_03840 [Caballeronia sordidicola]|uniref:Uncharacterized protein n=1 Tax=Caballeronia sordidicola TaxID=196367 RepID=A0A242N8T2_CABSO|nr:hypothetical protein PAMC26510_03840 [Caballeronia sordidicola]
MHNKIGLKAVLLCGMRPKHLRNEKMLVLRAKWKLRYLQSCRASSA